MEIWLVGDPDDLSAAYVGWLAEQRGISVLGLREDRLGLDWWFGSDRRGGIRVTLAGGRVVPIQRTTGAFVRLNPEPAVSDALSIPEDLKPIYLQERRAGLQFFLDALPFVVINRPSAGRANGSKPFQMAQLVSGGFFVPPWVATNQPAVAEEFLAHYPDAVVKACSGLRSHVRRMDESILERLTRGTAPVLIQQYVDGHEVRIHVSGDRIFATRIDSDALDYRFDTSRVSFAPVDAPGDLADRCRSFAHAQRLLLAGFDFRVDHAGVWWCLEMNPVPTFLPFEAGAGHPLGDTVLDLLAPNRRKEVTESPLAQRFRPARLQQ